MDYESRKIALPEECMSLEPFPVRRYHIDTNEHVNNCQYVQMAIEMLDQERVIRQDVYKRQCYETSDAIRIQTTLLGPAKGEKTKEKKTYPYVVMKTEYREKDVIFE